MGADGTLVDLQEQVGKRLVALSHRDRASSHVMTWKPGAFYSRARRWLRYGVSTDF